MIAAKAIHHGRVVAFEPLGRRGLSVAEFNEQLFSFGMRIHVMHHDGSIPQVHSWEELGAQHARVNDEAKQDGRIHLDLLLSP